MLYDFKFEVYTDFEEKIERLKLVVCVRVYYNYDVDLNLNLKKKINC